jgi:hypothetical protein
MDTEQNSSLLDNIANIGAVTIGTIKSGIMAISTAIGLDRCGCAALSVCASWIYRASKGY